MVAPCNATKENRACILTMALVCKGSCFQLCCATGASCSKRDTWLPSALRKQEEGKEHPSRVSSRLPSFWAGECCNASLLCARHTNCHKQPETSASAQGELSLTSILVISIYTDKAPEDNKGMQTWSCQVQACLLLQIKVLICHDLSSNCWALWCRQNLHLDCHCAVPPEQSQWLTSQQCQHAWLG